MVRSPRPRGGATALEFILALPVFLIMVLGVADLSAYLSSLYTVQRAARDGARVGAITLEGTNPNGAKIEAAAAAQARVVLAADGRTCGSDCSVTADWFSVDDFRYVMVYVAIPHHPITPGLGLVPNVATAQFIMLTQEQ